MPDRVADSLKRSPASCQTSGMRSVASLPALIVFAALLLGAGGAEGRYGFELEGATVPRDSIVAGGPGRDGIRSVDEPELRKGKTSVR